VIVGDAEDERRLAVKQSHPVLRACRRSAAYHRPMTQDGLSEALRDVRGFVLDADGVIVLKGAPLPGSVGAIRALQERRIPFRVVTNFSQLHRETMAGWFAKAGLAIDSDAIITASSATATYTASAHAGRPLFVLSADDAGREFDGQHRVTADEADALPAGTVGAVVIGDAGDDLSYRNLDVAFRLVRGGAELLAMHRNPWWLTERGETLDAGGFVACLEFATGKRARVLGKPSPEVFRQAVNGLRADLDERLPAFSFAMIGDDPLADVAAAQRVGMRGVLVLSGKTQRSDLATVVRRGRGPDAIAATLADVVAALD
jgi:HAD superfamily hydrolase (TIGR01458 family)